MAGIFKRDSTWYIRWRDASGWTQRATEAKSRLEAKGLAAELELEEQARRRLEFREAAGLEAIQEDLPGTLASLCRWWLKERCSETSRAIECRRLEKHVICRPAGVVPLGLVRETVIENLLSDMERGRFAGVRQQAAIHSAFGFQPRSSGRAVDWREPGRCNATAEGPQARLRDAHARSGGQNARAGSRRLAAALCVWAGSGAAQGRAFRAAEVGRGPGARHSHSGPLARARHDEDRRGGRPAHSCNAAALARAPA